MLQKPSPLTSHLSKLGSPDPTNPRAIVSASVMLVDPSAFTSPHWQKSPMPFWSVSA